MNPINLISPLFRTSPEKIHTQLNKKGVDLNHVQVERILHSIEKTKVTPDNANRKDVIASVLNKVETRLGHLEQKHGIDPKSSYAKINTIRENWQITKPQVDKTLLREKILRAVERAKILGKGTSVNPNAKVMEPTYWLETMTFQLNGKNVRLYGPTLYPEFVKWKENPTRDFQTVMQEKIDNMSAAEKQNLERSVLKLLSKSELEEHRAEFKDGKIHVGDKPLENGTYIFVVDPEQKNLYVGKKESGKFQHSSFMQGGAVGSAGMIDVHNGKISGIKNHSGHYAPPGEMLDPALKLILEESGQAQKEIRVSKLGGKSQKVVSKAIQIMARIGLLKA